jgi:hypothetical protein
MYLTENNYPSLVSLERYKAAVVVRVATGVVEVL